MSYIHIICTCSCALFICACLISAHMYLYVAYVHIRARHRGEKSLRELVELKNVLFNLQTLVSTCVHVNVSAVFSNSPRRISGFNIHIVFVASIFESAFTNLSLVTMFEGARLWLFPCCYPHLPKFISKRVAATDIHFSGTPAAFTQGRSHSIPETWRGSPACVIKHGSGDQVIPQCHVPRFTMFYLAKYQPLIGEPSHVSWHRRVVHLFTMKPSPPCRAASYSNIRWRGNQPFPGDGKCHGDPGEIGYELVFQTIPVPKNKSNISVISSRHPRWSRRKWWSGRGDIHYVHGRNKQMKSCSRP